MNTRSLCKTAHRIGMSKVFVTTFVHDLFYRSVYSVGACVEGTYTCTSEDIKGQGSCRTILGRSRSQVMPQMPGSLLFNQVIMPIYSLLDENYTVPSFLFQKMMPPDSAPDIPQKSSHLNRILIAFHILAHMELEDILHGMFGRISNHKFKLARSMLI